jgi:2-polyprenyl-6-hydroxyphenyl methylase/3-demethylubiquinone-9 3-methyltransferase
MGHKDEIDSGRRFAFGENWAEFLGALDDSRIETAEESLRTMLGVKSLAGMGFLDIGSGSGLFSLAARRLGANVTSFDFDPRSVACTRELKRRYFDGDAQWVVGEGSVLDQEFVAQLPQADIVYSWGVLHHTGHMWLAIERAISRVTEGGLLFIAIYNDQGLKSHCWWLIKYIYNRLPATLRKPYAYALGWAVHGANILRYTLKLKTMQALRPLLEYRKRRGMSVMRDIVDWIGGFPYEFARFEALQDYMAARGLVLVNGRPNTSLGCHEMVFRRGSGI